MPRKTPRPPDEARAIARNLRRRFISPEAEATAKAAMNRLEASKAGTAAPGRSKMPLDPMRSREQIEVKGQVAEAPFTDEERARARAILDRLHMAYPKNS